MQRTSTDWVLPLYDGFGISHLILIGHFLLLLFEFVVAGGIPTHHKL
jgi:hypothetical protein